VKHSITAAHKAAHASAAFMTNELRRSALEHGWHPDVVHNMNVRYTGSDFVVDIHPDYQDRAFVHEFGNEHTRPTAVIRKYNNDGFNYERVMHMHLNEALGGIL